MTNDLISVANGIRYIVVRIKTKICKMNVIQRTGKFEACVAAVLRIRTIDGLCKNRKKFDYAPIETTCMRRDPVRVLRNIYIGRLFLLFSPG